MSSPLKIGSGDRRSSRLQQAAKAFSSGDHCQFGGKRQKRSFHYGKND